MIAISAVADTAQGFIPLAQLLRTIGALKLQGAQQRACKFGREELLNHYRAAFKAGQRKRAYVLARALVANGVPPFVWHETSAFDNLTVNMRYDLFLADLMWLRRHYPEHAKVVRYKRGQQMLTGGETVFHREAQYAFYEGRRAGWKLVGSLSLSPDQQWEACYLRSAPIKKRAGITAATSDHVFNVLQDDLRNVRRTATFGEMEALAALRRRHALWRCSRMVDGASPTATALRYEQLTGASISRQAVAQQLEKVRSALARAKVTFKD